VAYSTYAERGGTLKSDRWAPSKAEMLRFSANFKVCDFIHFHRPGECNFADRRGLCTQPVKYRAKAGSSGVTFVLGEVVWACEEHRTVLILNTLAEVIS
jgi:hypothetical protein